MSSKLKIIQTEDGSSSIFNEELNETYHSTHGAIQESSHVFVEHGLNHWLSQHRGAPVRILEVGMGTGLNIILTLKAQLEIGFPVTYTTLEPYPLSTETIAALNYKQQLNHTILTELFDRLHDLAWNEPQSLYLEFELTKLTLRLEDYQTEQQFDVVYFDAFAPNKQPELWDRQWLAKLHYFMAEGGVFVTYCAKGQFKRDLKSVGFEVETLDGPPGKKEMVRGVK